MYPGPVFEGWGTALAWFAHVTGGWPRAEREALADRLFGHDGLAFSIARYNIGGGNAPGIAPYLRVGADVPGDPESFDGMASPLAFAEHVVGDLRRLEPSAWVFWQAVETVSARGGAKGSNWGLIKADLSAGDDAAHVLHLTRKYWVMAQVSRYIAPGYALVRVDDPDTVGALSPDQQRLVLVHVNAGPALRRIVVPSGWHAQRVLTDATHGAACVAGLEAAPRSVVTLILTRRPVKDACAW
ncbi:hypothetical protein MTR62_00905 [Novosphingobium sp. 1949]|uniref:Uncharacterized protein n=1 Tax=Novosphingobium organovorum TaxID=2930092 RepID=A0ABT0B905_9SPHN|nr:hypothetical protein [Novosphingobium organovorum]MCJ2181274.1 hypothetical protein [Novosphingobium organovorum]